MPPPQPPATIYVCSVGSCRRAASEAVLLDLEELCSLVAYGDVSQQPQVVKGGCLGYCSQAPNALLVLSDGDGDGTERVFTRLSTPIAIAELAVTAGSAVAATRTGTTDSSEEQRSVTPELLLQQAATLDEATPRTARARLLRAINASVAEWRWNSAAQQALELCGGDAAACPNTEFVETYCRILVLARAWAAAHLVFVAQLQRSPPAPSRLRVWAAAGAAQCLVQLGMSEDAFMLLSTEQSALRALSRQPTAETEPLMHMLSSTRSRLSALAQATGPRLQFSTQLLPPPVPTGYERWQVLSMEPLSSWSFTITAQAPPLSVFRTAATRRERVHTSLWHVIALAELLRPMEGPLPLLEREYTPISSAEDWALGRVTLLVRLYPGATVTPWLARLATELPNTRAGAGTLLLGNPLSTVPDDDQASNAAAKVPGPVLIACGGTGITVALQLITCRRHAWSGQPCSVIYSCRSDDVLLLPQLESAAAGRSAATRIRVQCTPAVQGQDPPFVVADRADLGGSMTKPRDALPFRHVHAGRVCAQAVSEELAWLHRAVEKRRRRRQIHLGDIWVLVCGPSGFVQTVQAALVLAGLSRERITVLAG